MDFLKGLCIKMTLFNSEKDRDLWIKLNAERQIKWEMGLTYFNKETGKDEPTLQALNPRNMEEAIRISKNQLDFDEKEGKLRFTLEELLTLDIKDLTKIQDKQHQEWCRKFEELK